MVGKLPRRVDEIALLLAALDVTLEVAGPDGTGGVVTEAAEVDAAAASLVEGALPLRLVEVG